MTKLHFLLLSLFGCGCIVALMSEGSASSRDIAPAYLPGYWQVINNGTVPLDEDQLKALQTDMEQKTGGECIAANVLPTDVAKSQWAPAQGSLDKGKKATVVVCEKPFRSQH